MLPAPTDCPAATKIAGCAPPTLGESDESVMATAGSSGVSANYGTVLHDLWDRITFAAEGLWLRLDDLFDALRNRRFGLPLAGLAVLVLVGVVAALLLGGGSDTKRSSATTAPLTPVEPPSAISASQFVQERGFSIALPDAWHRTKPPEGASFAARSDDGLGEATLWVDRDPKLEFDTFIDQSLAGLEQLGENAEVSARVEGSSLETSIAELRADVPLDGGLAGPYHVTLRAAGPYRYYLATSIGAGAPARLLADAELLGASFRPNVEVKDPTQD